MQIYFLSRIWLYLPRVPILVEGNVCGECMETEDKEGTRPR